MERKRIQFGFEQRLSGFSKKINDPFVRYLKYLSSCTKFVVNSVKVFTNTNFCLFVCLFACLFGVIAEGHCRWRSVIGEQVITQQACSWWRPPVFNHPPFMLLRCGQRWFLFSTQVRGLLEVLHSSAEVASLFRAREHK